MRRLVLGLLALPVMAQSSAASLPDTAPRIAWQKALQDHLQRHPRAEAVDVYKFIHQSLLGPGHLIPDVERARGFLETEMQSMGAAPAGEPLQESLGGSPAMVRVNLRPFLAQGGDAKRLLAAFVATGNAVKGDPGMLALRLRAGVELLREMGREECAARLELLAGGQAGKGFEALHHSDAYRTAYRPAYRVILEDLAKDLLRDR